MTTTSWSTSCIFQVVKCKYLRTRALPCKPNQIRNQRPRLLRNALILCRKAKKESFVNQCQIMYSILIKIVNNNYLLRVNGKAKISTKHISNTLKMLKTLKSLQNPQNASNKNFFGTGLHPPPCFSI